MTITQSVDVESGPSEPIAGKRTRLRLRGDSVAAAAAAAVFLSLGSVDASKAFDRVDHKVLFQKLVNRVAPRCFVGVLRSWYGKLVSAVGSVRWTCF